jgi:hypothetical protein
MESNVIDGLVENDITSQQQEGEQCPSDNEVVAPSSLLRDALQRNSIKDSNYFGLEMREQDADWLEAMHVNGGPNRTGMTPVLTSTAAYHSSADGAYNHPGTPPAFSLSLDGDDNMQQVLTFDEVKSMRTSPQSPSTKSKNKLIPYLPNNSPRIKSELQAANDENCTTSGNDTICAVTDVSDENIDITTQDNASLIRRMSALTTIENSVMTPLIPPRRSIHTSDRPVLSGTIYEEGTTISASQSQFKSAADASAIESIASMPLRDVVSVETPLPGSEHSIMTGKQRDGFKSDDEEEHKNEAKHRRKITEVAQFADAVGDSALDVQIIEDDDDDDRGENAHGADDDDDDDDATEIHIDQQQRNVVGGLLPIKMRSSSILQHPAVVPKMGHSMNDTVSSRIPGPDEIPETPIKVRAVNTQQLDTTMKRHTLQLDPTVESTTAVSTTTTTTTNSSSPSRIGFLAQLPTSASMCTSHDFVYKGIGANPPEIVKRGTTRGNYAQLHRKAWLEVTDKYHRYGKNLRLYYRYWESQGHPTNIFFDWLDSKGEAAGNELPELKECPRRQLDSDTVLYINNPDVTQGYAINVVVEQNDDLKNDSQSNTDGIRRGRMYDIDGNPVCTGPDGWIFVLRDNIMYGAKKITSISGQSRQRFHHSSFFGGKAVAAAGIFITDDDGYLTRLYPHSGHYRPGEAHMQRVLFYLYHEGVDLRSFEMDTQQILHVARDGNDATKDKKKDKDGNTIEKVMPTEKKKKVEALHLMPAVYIACFLAHKARFIGEGIFAQIHQIRQSDVASVSEALAVIDNKGLRGNVKK